MDSLGALALDLDIDKGEYEQMNSETTKNIPILRIQLLKSTFYASLFSSKNTSNRKKRTDERHGKKE